MTQTADSHLVAAAMILVLVAVVEAETVVLAIVVAEVGTVVLGADTAATYDESLLVFYS